MSNQQIRPLNGRIYCDVFIGKIIARLVIVKKISSNLMATILYNIVFILKVIIVSYRFNRIAQKLLLPNISRNAVLLYELNIIPLLFYKYC